SSPAACRSSSRAYLRTIRSPKNRPKKFAAPPFIRHSGFFVTGWENHRWESFLTGNALYLLASSCGGARWRRNLVACELDGQSRRVVERSASGVSILCNQLAQARILSPIVSSSHLLAKNSGELIRAFAGVPKGNHCKGIQIAPLGLFLVRSKNSPSASAFFK